MSKQDSCYEQFFLGNYDSSQEIYLQILKKVLNYMYAGVAQRQSIVIVNRRLGVRFPSPAFIMQIYMIYITIIWELHRILFILWSFFLISTLQINKNVLNYIYTVFGGIAQLGERLNGIQEASGWARFSPFSRGCSLVQSSGFPSRLCGFRFPSSAYDLTPYVQAPGWTDNLTHKTPCLFQGVYYLG